MCCGKQSLNNFRVGNYGVFCAQNPGGIESAKCVNPCGETLFGVFFYTL